MAVITGKNGGETLTGGSSNDTITGGTGHDRILTGDGSDLIEGGDGNDQINGYPTTGGAYTYWTFAGTKTINGGNGDDFIYGADGSDSVNGGSGNDSIHGSSGSDTLDGGLGNDELFGGTGNDLISGGLGNDELYGDDGDDTLEGSAGNDSIYGRSGNDSVNGSEGDDYLAGGDGTDTIFGGAGNDTLTKYLALGNSYLDGGIGDDTIWGGNANDTIIGGDGNDSWLEGYKGDDSIFGGSGNDKLFGDEGNDALDGGVGDDTVYGGNGYNSLIGGAGNDSIAGGINNDSIYGGTGNDSLYGGNGNDYEDGEDGDDYFVEQYSGDDTLIGGAGNDYFNAYTGTGNKFIDGGSGNDNIYGGEGNDTLIGGAGYDTLNGSTGNDRLEGGTGNDALDGGTGNDTLDGGEGNDTFNGGDGNDTYFIDSTFDYIYDSDGNDTAYVSTSFVKIPSSIEKVNYVNGAQALPYWISALLPDETAGKRFTTLLGDSKTFGYIFPSTLPSYEKSTKDANGFTQFTSTQQTRTVDALTYIASLLDLQFNKVTDPAAKNTFTFASNIQTNSGGYASHPSSSFEGNDVYLHIYASNTTLADGTYGALTLIHEIGHALGLKHPFDHEQAGEGGIAEAPYLTGAEENAIWTVMSYEKTKAQYLIQFSPLDIAALQYLYGPSKTARTGNDTYKISTTTPNFVWDGAGLDLIDAGSVNQAATVYLTPGYQGFLGSAKAEKITTSGQITVNFGSVIENLIGSNYDDNLYGNEVGNKIEGGAGSDSIEGWDGDDTLLGGAGNDLLTGGSGNDSIEGGEGNDTLVLNGLANSYAIRYDSATQSYSVEPRSGTEGKDTFKTVEFLKFSDKTVALQNLDTSSPTIAITSNVNSLRMGETALVSFSISESVNDFVASDIAVTGGTLSYFTGSGTAYAGIFTPALNFTGTASIKVASGKFTDSAGNTNEDGAENNNNLSISIDTQAPVVTTYLPENLAKKVAVSSDIVLTISEKIQKGLGSVVLKTSAGITVATYDVATSKNLTLSGATLTINPTDNLSFDTSYKVEISSGAFKDLLGNNLAAVSSYTFTTNTNKSPTGNVTIAGTLKQGQTLQAMNTLADADGLGAITYQWQTSSDGINWVKTSTGAGDRFTLSEREVDFQIRVVASYTDGQGTLETLTSLATDALRVNLISGTSSSDLILGTAYADNISSNAGHDTIAGGLGSDVIDGGAGIDTVKFSGQFGSSGLANYSIQKMNNGSWTVSYIGPIIAIFPPPSTDGVDSLTNVERLQFTDKSFALDLDGHAGTNAKVIGAVLGKTALKDPANFGIYLSYLDKGMSYSDLGALVLNQVGAVTNDSIVSRLWLNVIGSPASPLDKAPFVKMLDDGMKAGDLVVLAAETTFNTSNINLVGLALTGIEYTAI
jgi:Ca2+-binding RTX toxin-like protein